MILKINCKDEQFEKFIKINKKDREKTMEAFKKYNDSWNDGEIVCSYTDFLSENNIDYVEVEFETIEI